MAESSLQRLEPDEKLKNCEHDSIILNSTSTSPKTKKETVTKSYFVSLHECSRNGRELSTVFNDQNIEFDNNKLTDLDSITVSKQPSSDNGLANKKYVVDSLGSVNILGFNQTLQNHIKVSVGNDTNNLAKYDIKRIFDTTSIKSLNTGGYLLQQWNKKCNEKNKKSKLQIFNKSTETNNPASRSGATRLTPIGDGVMCLETSSNNHGNNVFVSFERTDIIQTSNITFYNNRFSTITNDSLESVGRFTIQLILEDNTFSTRYKKPKNDRYSGRN